MPRRPPVPVVQTAAERRTRGESLRPRRKHTFDGQTLNTRKGSCSSAPLLLCVKTPIPAFAIGGGI